MLQIEIFGVTWCKFRKNDVSLLFVSVHFRFNFASCLVYVCKVTQYWVSIQTKHQIFCGVTALKNVNHLKMNYLDIKNLRTTLGVTQKQLAEMVGVSVNTIQNWESGGKIPKSKHPILASLTQNPHIVFGGQHVQHGDAVNGNKIIESINEEQDQIEEKVTIIERVECDLDNIRAELADLKKTHAEVVAQNSRLLAIIETLTKTPSI